MTALPRTYATALADQQLERTLAARGGAPYPERITQALDAPAGGGPSLEGPGVDAACGAVEPAVDRWEAGEEIPTRHQLELLGALTGYPVSFFFREPAPPLEGGFMCVRSGKGKGCYRPDDPALLRALRPTPQQLDLMPTSEVPAAPPSAPLPSPPPGELPECSGPCGRPMRRDVWRRQRGRCSRCGPVQ